MHTKNSNRLRNSVILALVAVLSTAGCGKEKTENKSDDSGKSQETFSETFKSDGPGESKVKPDDRDLSKVKPDFTLSSIDFAGEYKKDEKAAEAKYKGKVIELSGRIVGFGQNSEKTHYLELYATGIAEVVWASFGW